MLRRYKSHKIVEAAKIWAIGEADHNGETSLYLDEGKGVVYVDQAYMDKHKPQCGGYFVQYEDGYQSWSPADAFEAGNIPLPDAVAGMAPHQQRVIDEKAELDERLEKLAAFHSTDIFEKLPTAERRRLTLQLGAMREYADILGQRIAAFQQS